MRKARRGAHERDCRVLLAHPDLSRPADPRRRSTRTLPRLDPPVLSQLIELALALRPHAVVCGVAARPDGSWPDGHIGGQLGNPSWSRRGGVPSAVRRSPLTGDRKGCRPGALRCVPPSGFWSESLPARGAPPGRRSRPGADTPEGGEGCCVREHGPLVGSCRVSGTALTRAASPAGRTARRGKRLADRGRRTGAATPRLMEIASAA